MGARKIALWTMLGALALTARATVAADQGQQQQQKPQAPLFRSAVTLVPVDVRVVDRSGKPVTDLTQADFTITEDGAKQEIRHFSLQLFTPMEPEPGAKLTLVEQPISLETQTNRIFLIVLGRGKLQEPSRTVDALIRFVRERLLPQDQLAVFAYDRASTFTTDHEKVARLLERFRAEHEQIDFEIGLQMSGLAGVYGSKLIPRTLQRKIDQMFEGAGLLASQRVDPGATADKQIEKDAGRQIDAQIQKQLEVFKAEAAAAAGVPNLTAWTDIDEMQTQMFADLPLEQFIDATAQTLQDLGNIYAGIEYLRHFEGEKHLIYLTERGLTMPRLEEDERLAAVANDARVALDTIETGGIYVGATGGEIAQSEGRWNMTFAIKTLRTIADLTGGVSSIMEPGLTAMDRINDVTRSTYLLGYYPTNPKWDGTYRKVTVKVNRPGVSVFYRHGYYGRKDLPVFSRREFITQDRIQAAASFRRPITDIRVKLGASLARLKDGSGFEMNIDLNIDPEKLAFTFVEGVHVGRITIAVFCFDDKGELVGQSLQTADLKLKDENFQRIMSGGIPYKVRFSTGSGTRRVRAVVYDFKADLLGSADKPVV